MTKRNKIIAGVVCATLVVAVLYGARVSVMSDLESTINSQADASVIGAAYPLFASGITWGDKLAVTLPPRSNYNPATSTIVGYQVMSLPTAPTNNLAAVAEPMRNYYDGLLLKNGWKIDINFQADGPGGSVWGYTKGDQILIFSYSTTFLNNQPDRPVECPCTVTFTIIGGVLR